VADVITITVASGSSIVTTTPTGTLTITVDGTTETSSLALSGGTATYSFSSTTTGSHTIVATYSGNSIYAASSGSVVVTIGSSSTTGSGGSGSSTVTVTPSGGYTGTVDFSLATSSSYLQNYACYTLSNASVTGTTAVSQTLTVYLGTTTCASVATSGKNTYAFKASSANQMSANQPHPLRNDSGVQAAAFSLAGVLLAGLVGWRFRRLRAFAAVALLAVLGFALSGCSGSTASSSSTSSSKSFVVSLSPTTVTISAGASGVPTGSYSITVEGEDSSSSSIYSTATLALTVD
jgi:hypothetical protein